MGRPALLRRVGHPAGDRQTVTEGAGRVLDPWNGMCRMTNQRAAVSVECIEPTYGEEAHLRQCCIERRTRVTLAVDEPVAFRPCRVLGVQLEHTPVQDGEDVRHGKAASDVGTTGPNGHVQHVTPYASC